LAALLLALSNGCGSPRDTTAIDGTPAVPDQSPRAAFQRPVITAVADTVAVAKAPSSAGVKLSGRVVFRGTPPARRRINMTKDAKCIELHGDQPVLDEDVIVSSGGGLKNAFVRVLRAPKMDYPMPEEPAVLNQKGCMFRPRVQGVRVGQRLLVGNGDPVTHNVRSFPTLNPAFNFGQPPDTDPRERVFERAEREIEVQCDFHLWMHAYIFVMDHPFFSVSEDDGEYAIDGLPPGNYTLETWHEKFGRQRKTVEVGSDDVADVHFTFPR
jgi:hypothetical protein